MKKYILKSACLSAIISIMVAYSHFSIPRWGINLVVVFIVIVIFAACNDAKLQKNEMLTAILCAIISTVIWAVAEKDPSVHNFFAENSLIEFGRNSLDKGYQFFVTIGKGGVPPIWTTTMLSIFIGTIILRPKD